MKKAQKKHLITLRVTGITHNAIQKSRKDHILRDGAPYTFNEVARYLLNTGLYTEGKLPHIPILDGRGAHSKLSLQSELEAIRKREAQAQRHLKQLTARTSALSKRVSNGKAVL